MPSKLRIGIFGASGRFGRAIAAQALDDPEFSLSAALVHPASPHREKDLGALLERPPLGLGFSTSLTDLQGPVDVLIDASLPSGFADRATIALEKKIPFVVGSTGLSPEDFERLEAASRSLPVFYAPNFSLGIALMHQFAKTAARLFNEARIELIETHHTEKKDAPSGAALSIVKAIRQASPLSSISIESVRRGKVVGDHALSFHAEEELFTIRHEAHSRIAFARGALAAARFLFAQKPGLYGMEDLLAAVKPGQSATVSSATPSGT